MKRYDRIAPSSSCDRGGRHSAFVLHAHGAHQQAGPGILTLLVGVILALLSLSCLWSQASGKGRLKR